MTPPKATKYLEIARAVANLSKDNSTKVGAVILGPNYEVRSVGYNGAPRGCVADEDTRNERPEKYWWFAHAEANAIYNAARVGTPLDGGTLIVTHPPCMDCAKAIVQTGIKTVVYPSPDTEFVARWYDHLARVKTLFDECGVDVQVVERSVPVTTEVAP